MAMEPYGCFSRNDIFQEDNNAFSALQNIDAKFRFKGGGSVKLNRTVATNFQWSRKNVVNFFAALHIRVIMKYIAEWKEIKKYIFFPFTVYLWIYIKTKGLLDFSSKGIFMHSMFQIQFYEMFLQREENTYFTEVR